MEFRQKWDSLLPKFQISRDRNGGKIERETDLPKTTTVDHIAMSGFFFFFFFEGSH